MRDTTNADSDETGDESYDAGLFAIANDEDLGAFDAVRAEADAGGDFTGVLFGLPPSTPAPSSRASAIGKDEMNLAEFPFAVLARRVAPGQKTIEVVQEGRDAEGRPVRQEWMVTGSDAFGLPTAADDEVYVALMKLLRDNQFRERTVRFTVAQLLRVMQSSAGKRDYDRIAASLDRLTGVTLRSRNAFWDHARKRYVTEAFHLLDSYRLATGGTGRDLSEVTFSSFLFGSIEAGYVKNLDIDFYFSLSTPLARRYFRLLDKHRYRGRVYEIELRRLAAKLPLQDKFESQLKRRLDPVFEELKERGFLKSAEYRTGAGGATIVSVRFADRAVLLPNAGHTPVQGILLPDTEPEEDTAAADEVLKLTETLRAEGVNRADAERLVREMPDECRRQLEYLPFVREFKKSRGAYLRSAIEQGFGPPAAWSEAQEAGKRRERRSKRTAAESPEITPHPASETATDEAALTAEMVRLRSDEPEAWSALVTAAEAALPPPVRSRPDGPAFRPALESEIRKRVSERIRS